MAPVDLSRLLQHLPDDFDRQRFEAVYAAAAKAASMRTPGREPGYRLVHGHRVARLGLELLGQPDVAAAGPGPDARVVVWLGGLIHDLFKETLGADPPGVDHGDRAARWAAQSLPAYFGEAVSRQVAEACYLHNKRHLPAPVEAQVLQDADLLDHFGAQEIWLAAYYSGSRDQGLDDSLVYLTGPRNTGWRRYALEHIRFESARDALRERLSYADALIRRLEAESQGRLWPPGALW